MRYLLIMIFGLLPLVACAEAKTEGACVVGGCSGQLCVRADAVDGGVSTCEWTAAYACYSQFGECAQNADGSCGWRDTPTLRDCLKDPENYTLRVMQPMGEQHRDALELRHGDSPRSQPFYGN